MPGRLFAPSQRRRILKRDGYRCQQCGRHKDNLPPTEYLTIDHIVPRSAGGSKNDANLQVLCRFCNERKGTSYTLKNDAELAAEAKREEKRLRNRARAALAKENRKKYARGKR